jgi:RND family efflux transporter MFP subunit
MPGELESFESVAVFSRVTAFVKSMHVDRGSRVRTGDLVAQLEAPELVAQKAEAQSKRQAALAQVSAARAKADADASTYEHLKSAAATPGVVAGNDLVLAQKALETDQSQLAAAQQNAEAAEQAVRSITELEGYLRVTAPFAGVVTERNVHPGALVGPSGGAPAQPMVRIVNIERLRLVVSVPEVYVGGVKRGLELPFVVAAYPGESFTARLTRISSALDVKTRAMPVEFDVDNKAGRLAPGAFCQVRWPISRNGPSLLVPAASIASTTDRVFVVRVRNGRIEWVDVKTGITAGPLVEVFGDLKAGDTVAARGTDELRPGAEVRIGGGS